jgi:hypothetical protein
VVAGVLSFCPATRLAARCDARASGRELPEETLVPAAHPGHGRWTGNLSVEHTLPPQLSFASAPWVRRRGKPGARYTWTREGCYPG